jgi:glutathione S-transferase
MTLLWGLRLGGPSLADYSELAGWFARLSGRPAFAAAVEEVAEADRRLSYPVKRR